ncbi:hypothetical protein ACH5RR_029310 [Cinchona calisaya]|uniref:DUF4283 domain-containing protein n=1 Tax=Cinchona calisaya TaxID=153742 RepID=A0ABD2YRA0_9GENT
MVLCLRVIRGFNTRVSFGFVANEHRVSETSRVCIARLERLSFGFARNGGFIIWVQKWTSDFHVDIESSVVLKWVVLEKLPVQYYDKQTL